MISINDWKIQLLRVVVCIIKCKDQTLIGRFSHSVVLLNTALITSNVLVIYIYAPQGFVLI